MIPRATIGHAVAFTMSFAVLVLTGCGDTGLPPPPTLGQADESDAIADNMEAASSNSIGANTTGGVNAGGLSAAQPPAPNPAPAPSPAPWTTTSLGSLGGTSGTQLPLDPGNLLGNLSGLLGSVFSTATGLLGGVLTIPQSLLGTLGGGNGP
ncbi:MAG: hypothetical protein RL011_1719 [Pseudomonadota bacterium]|jgi:hypothetical protein